MYGIKLLHIDTWAPTLQKSANTANHKWGKCRRARKELCPSASPSFSLVIEGNFIRDRRRAKRRTTAPRIRYVGTTRINSLCRYCAYMPECFICTTWLGLSSTPEKMNLAPIITPMMLPGGLDGKST